MKQIINSHKLQELIEKRESFLVDAEKYALEIEYLTDEIDRLTEQAPETTLTNETILVAESGRL